MKVEMDKARNVRSGFSNTNKQRHKNFGVFAASSIRGDLKSSEKSKKEKVRSLSSVSKALSNYQHCQMGCHVSEKEEHEPSSSTVIPITKRFKIPKNLLNDCNGVHHASVPRKLRSAMKKRSRESILLDSEKVKHKISGIESSEKDGIKKCKKQGISRVSGPITKDEEEVAETLYALAGMFHDNSTNDNSNKEIQSESLPGNNINDALEASGSAQHASPCPERSPKESSKANSLHETIGEDHLQNLHSITPTINLQTMPVMVRCENSNKDALHDSELCLEMGLNMPRQSHISHYKRKPDVEFEAARGVDKKQEQHVIKVKDQKANEGLALWPGLSPASSSVDQAYLQSCAANAPDWLKAAICASKQEFFGSCSSGGKVPEVIIHKRSWKRCAAHVHISHIIRNLEVPKRHVKKEPELYECDQITSHEGSRHRIPLEVHNLNGVRNGVSSAHGTGHFIDFERNPHGSNNGILQQQCHVRDTSSSQAAPPTHGVIGPQKQCYNFLSLSAESNGLRRVDNSCNKNGSSRLEQCSKLQVPYFQSLPQQHGLFMPIPAPQIQHASTSYHDQLFVAGPQVRLQQPQYYGSPLCGTRYSSIVSNKQQQQSFWAVHLAAQDRSAVNSNIMRSQYPNWQSGKHDSVVSPCAQATLPRSIASPEVLGTKITSISGQKQQLLIAPIQEKWARTPSPFCM